MVAHLQTHLPLQVGELRHQRAGVAPNPVPVVHLFPSGQAAERLRELPHGDCLREQPHLQDLSFPGLVWCGFLCAPLSLQARVGSRAWRG